MCIFSSEVSKVSDTEIFVSLDNKGMQVIVYQNKFDTATQNAMIIPIPESHAGDDSVEFINLENHPDFFNDIRATWPRTKSLTRSFGINQMKSLEVHKVGTFEASYVPSQEQFSRLDDRFIINKELWELLPEYEDYGFVVFKFATGKQKPHPMAFRFKSAQPENAYFPTVHIHDEDVHAEEQFDHTLYLQKELINSAPFGWKSNENGNTKILDKYKELNIFLDVKNKIYKHRVIGLHQNKDIII